MPLDAQPATRLDARSRDVQQHPRCYSIRARWACVYTHPQAEFWANANLNRAGYRTYLPTHAVQRRDRVTPTMRHTVTVPLFARYLFLQFDHRAESWSPIRAAPGVADLIRSGPDLHYASEAAVSALQASEDARRSPMPRNAPYRPGVACTPRDGPFQGLPGVVLSADADTATVGILFLGQLREIAFPFDSLAPREDF